MLHDGVNFHCFHLTGLLLLELLGSLHFNVAVDAVSLVGLNPDAFRRRFSHGDAVFFLFEVVSTLGCVGYQVMNQS